MENKKEISFESDSWYATHTSSRIRMISSLKVCRPAESNLYFIYKNV